MAAVHYCARKYFYMHADAIKEITDKVKKLGSFLQANSVVILGGWELSGNI